jgi:hypothetical protein
MVVAVLVLAAMGTFTRLTTGAVVRRPSMGSQAVAFQIPRLLKAEHDELHAELAQAEKVPGEIGVAAREVARVLHPHFVKEEEFALPPLGLLSAVASGAVTPQMKPAIEMTKRLKTELPHMLDEHKVIVSALAKLKVVADKGGRSDIGAFAEKLMHHAETEEEVLYPAAIVVGELLELKLR